MTTHANVAAALNLEARLRVGFFGRVSDEEKQDPSLSIPRQHNSVVKNVSEVGWDLTKSCWDIESGRKEIDVRGAGADGRLFGIDVPRDGGLPELLEFARAGEIDVVMVESIDRLSRTTADSTAIERELMKLDIPIFACDEPMNLNATSILTRRMKQGIAEWYVADLLEKSRAGMETSVRQGWHAGGPIAYGYIGDVHPHPNPHKASDGETKTKLVVCPVTAVVVQQIYTWYCVEMIGLGEIVDRLNSDLDLYPAPKRNKKDENQLVPCWAKATVQAILRNPKYTGFNVWNRHDKRRGRPTVRPKDQWIWSNEMTHEPLVSRELYDKVEAQARSNENASKAGQQTNRPSKRGRPGRFYVMRGHARCDLCNHSLQGTHQKGANYLRCLWASGRGNAAAKATGHPASLQVKEQLLIDEALDFLATRVFSAEAVVALRTEIESSEDPTPKDYAAQASELQDEITKIEKLIDRQVLVFEKYDDANHPVVLAAERRVVELTRGQRDRAASVEALTEKQRAQRPKAAPRLADILETLPDLCPALASYDDEELAELFDVFNLEARYNHTEKTLALSVTVFPELAAILESQRPADGAGRSKPSIAGAGFEPATSGL